MAVYSHSGVLHRKTGEHSFMGETQKHNADRSTLAARSSLASVAKQAELIDVAMSG